jgi:hypothetical protein
MKTLASSNSYSSSPFLRFEDTSAIPGHVHLLFCNMRFPVLKPNLKSMSTPGPKHSLLLRLTSWVLAMSRQHSFGKFPGMWFGPHSPTPPSTAASSSSSLEIYILTLHTLKTQEPVQPFNEAAATNSKLRD